MSLDMHQCIGAVLGIAGAVLVTSPKQPTRYNAFFCWTLSNLFIIGALLPLEAWPLIAMQSVYLVTSGIGLYRNRKGATP